MAAISTTGVVLIVGLLVLVIIIVGFVVIYGQNSNTLNQAGQNLEDAVSVLLASFDRFGTTIASSLTRLVTHLRDLFESFLGNIAAALASSITFFTNAFDRVFSTIEHIGTQVATQYNLFFNQVTDALINLTTQIAGKLITVPTDVGLRLILGFVTLITEGVQIITCFATKAVGEIESAFTAGLDSVETFFTSGLEGAEATIINTLGATLSNIYVAVEPLIGDIAALPGQVYNAIKPALDGILTAVNYITCKGLVPICHIFPDDHSTCEALRCAGGCNGDGCCTPCCPC